MAVEKTDELKHGTINTTLNEDIHFKGVLKFQKSLKINGRFEGEINAPSGTLIIGDNSLVHAKILVDRIKNHGIIHGNIQAHNSLELFHTGQINGNVAAKELTVQLGGILNGTCSMTVTNNK